MGERLERRQTAGAQLDRANACRGYDDLINCRQKAYCVNVLSGLSCQT
jgi:hypothetical protein